MLFFFLYKSCKHITISAVIFHYLSAQFVAFLIGPASSYYALNLTKNLTLCNFFVKSSCIC